MTEMARNWIVGLLVLLAGGLPAVSGAQEAKPAQARIAVAASCSQTQLKLHTQAHTV